MTEIQLIREMCCECNAIFNRYGIIDVAYYRGDDELLLYTAQGEIKIPKNEHDKIKEKAFELSEMEYLPCKECEGTGKTEVSDCSSLSASNCCGGCTKMVHCNECRGGGEIKNEYYYS